MPAPDQDRLFLDIVEGRVPDQRATAEQSDIPGVGCAARNAILSLGSMQVAKVKLALLLLDGRAMACEFHQRLFAMPGANDG
jgi:hypothetical protein